MTCSVRTLLAEPRPRTPHVCHGHHDEDAVAEWHRGLAILVRRLDGAERALQRTLERPRDGLLHPEECMRHLRRATSQIALLTTCACAIDEPGTLLAAGASLARVRAGAVMCSGTAMGAESRQALMIEASVITSDALTALWAVLDEPKLSRAVPARDERPPAPATVCV